MESTVTDAPDLLTRLDALRRYLLNQRDAAKTHTDPILRAQAERIIDGHLAAVDDACEALQIPA
jgi:hypothetical protein